jgi:hypothetical protein
MSADPTIFINGKYVGPVQTDDLAAYMAKHYPGAKYELKEGWKVMVTVSVVQAMEIRESRSRAVVVDD